MTVLNLTFLKDARGHTTTARVHSQVKSGPVSRSNGAAQCAIVRSIRTRTTSHDLDGRSKKRQVSKKIQKKIQKRKKILWTLAVTSPCRIFGILAFD